MGYSIFKYGSQMQTDIEDLEAAKKEALRFVTPITTGGDFIGRRIGGRLNPRRLYHS